MPEDGNDAPFRKTRPAGTLLGFDFGHRRIGVAVGQTLTATATALQVVKVAKQVDWKTLDEFISNWNPVALVVGLPLDSDGSDTPLSRDARQFARDLEERFGLQVFFEDERLTSVLAEQRFVQGRARGSMRRKDAALKDAMAAQIILENWLRAES